ncbi:bifunctional adenosylcobinamide kinase/adenosylcobinamide-phosphate guanylyltransferase [Algivirga pacifica]|uniref:Adenosylcobinamide kinase n=1 Tax=Algivirga pacifica TaxID=1162670 RepID=A0ABP9DIL3_9BACT
MIYYITGGERSGKSRYAQKLAESLSPSPYYLATARIWDEDFQQRVDRHQADRDERWTSIEEDKFISQLDLNGKTVVIDCVTLWLTNWFMDLNQNIEHCLKASKQELQILFEQDTTLIIISNEIGMGIHASTHVGRKFTELQGWINQYIGENAQQATLMVSGMPLTLKAIQ